MNCAWCTMVGIKSNTNLSNSNKVKLVKNLNNLDIAYIIMITSQTPMLQSTNWPMPYSTSLALNMWDELETQIVVAKANYFCLSMFVDTSCIMSSSHHHLRMKCYNYMFVDTSCIMSSSHHHLRMKGYNYMFVDTSCIMSSSHHHLRMKGYNYFVWS